MRSGDGRYSTRFDDLLLLDAVVAVAALADPPNGIAVTQRSFDPARHRSDGFADAPTARQIVAVLGLRWEAVLQVAHAPAADRSHYLAVLQRDAAVDWLTDDVVASALRVVARRLGHDTLTPIAYRGERAVVVAADAARHRHGGALRLPTENQITAHAGSWDAALELAGLEERRRGGSSPTGRSFDELLDLCFDAHGTEPTAGELELFARANGLRHGRRRRPWPAIVAEWKERRADAGLPVPDRPPPKKKRPDYAAPIARLQGADGRLNRWTLEDCVEAMARYLAEPGTRRPSQRGYDEWVRRTDGVPWSSVLGRYGGFDAVLAAARSAK
ncbi:MAG TPA: hypothetical protein VFT50_02015 [Baekduia sp.]|nr:hypothetical protein [Baekduia sp.]